MYIRMYILMDVRMSVRMYLCVHVCMYSCMYVHVNACTAVCMYVHMCVCMYVWPQLSWHHNESMRADLDVDLERRCDLTQVIVGWEVPACANGVGLVLVPVHSHVSCPGFCPYFGKLQFRGCLILVVCHAEVGAATRLPVLLHHVEGDGNAIEEASTITWNLHCCQQLCPGRALLRFVVASC